MNISIGAKYGHWTVAGVSGRTATCACRCGNVRIISADAIASGEAAGSCGCVPLTWQELHEARRQDAAAQARRNRDWRPGDRS